MLRGVKQMSFVSWQESSDLRNKLTCYTRQIHQVLKKQEAAPAVGRDRFHIIKQKNFLEYLFFNKYRTDGIFVVTKSIVRV